MPIFPEREKPKVVTYSLRKVYADIYDDLKAAFGEERPQGARLLSLVMYNPEPFRKGEADSELLNRDKQVIGLIRTLLLKRLESSYTIWTSRCDYSVSAKLRSCEAAKHSPIRSFAHSPIRPFAHSDLTPDKESHLNLQTVLQSV